MALSKSNFETVDRGRHSDSSVAWTAVPTLQNSWANKTGYQAAEYSRDKEGVVHLRGTLDSGTMTAGTLVTTLPVGFRPEAKTHFIVSVSASTTNYVGAIVVDVDGTVDIGNQTHQSSSYHSWAGISFASI